LTPVNVIVRFKPNPWHCILSAELTKTHSFRQFFFGAFAHWKKEIYH